MKFVFEQLGLFRHSLFDPGMAELFKVRADDDDGDAEPVEMVDPMDALRDKCKPHCNDFKTKLDQCDQRVRSRKNTTESCFEEIVDWMSCVDHCASKDLFSKLK
jgi:putative uncharacterized protein GLEAN_14895